VAGALILSNEGARSDRFGRTSAQPCQHFHGMELGWLKLARSYQFTEPTADLHVESLPTTWSN
jgi:hypothetical protein